jgi:hypothetical protein
MISRDRHYCFFVVVSNDHNRIRTKFIEGYTFATEPTVGEPFVMYGTALDADPQTHERRCNTSPVVAFETEHGLASNTYKLTTESGSRYDVTIRKEPIE